MTLTDDDPSVDPKRSAIVALVRSVDTKPEQLVRRIVHALGFRFRLHRRDLRGTPDLVFPRLGKIVLLHGYFWHRHAGCNHATKPTPVGWVERLVRRSSPSESGSETHQLV